MFLDHELREHKPESAPFPERVVKAREILLKLQVLLAAFENEELEVKKKEFAEKYLSAKHAYLQLAYKT